MTLITREKERNKHETKQTIKSFLLNKFVIKIFYKLVIKLNLLLKVMQLIQFEIHFNFKFSFFIAMAMSGNGVVDNVGDSNKLYSSNGISNGNVELENLYKYYKSTGQVRF